MQISRLVTFYFDRPSIEVCQCDRTKAYPFFSTRRASYLPASATCSGRHACTPRGWFQGHLSALPPRVPLSVRFYFGDSYPTNPQREGAYVYCVYCGREPHLYGYRAWSCTSLSTAIAMTVGPVLLPHPVWVYASVFQRRAHCVHLPSGSLYVPCVGTHPPIIAGDRVHAVCSLG